MKWLLWKDFRHNRLVVYVMLFLLLAPYLLALYLTLGGPWPGVAESHHSPIWRWSDNFGAASVASLFLGQVTFALIGGNAIAGERVDRSSDFLFSLPVARRRLFASKLLLVLLMGAAIWTNAAIYGSLFRYCYGAKPQEWNEVLQAGANLAITSLMFFCVAWMLSSFTPSPVLSICGALIAPAVVWGGLCCVAFLTYATDEYWRHFFTHAELWYRMICLAMAPACFIAGTWYYLRRVEP